MQWRRAATAAWLLVTVVSVMAGCGGPAGAPAQPASPPAEASKTPEPTAPTRPAPFKGYPAPEITGQNVFTGEKIQLSNLRGKTVLVNFWATWCPPCRLEMPDLQTLHTEMGDRLAIIAVGADPTERLDLLAAYAKDRQLTFPVVYDQGKGMDTYKVLALPTSFLIDGNGIIREKIQGAMSLEQMRDVVKTTEAAGGKSQ
jgi:thiol-disulfide isomerase/thioredoxin